MTTSQSPRRQQQTAVVEPIIDENSEELSCPVCGQLCFVSATPTVGSDQQTVLARICRRHRRRSIILPVPATIASDATPVEIEIDGAPFTAATPNDD